MRVHTSVCRETLTDEPLTGTRVYRTARFFRTGNVFEKNVLGACSIWHVICGEVTRQLEFDSFMHLIASGASNASGAQKAAA